MCNALAKCVKIDEAKDLHDKAKALAYYARHRKDPERDLLMSELTLRAEIRMGEISRQLEKVETTGPSSVRITSGGMLPLRIMAVEPHPNSKNRNAYSDSFP